MPDENRNPIDDENRNKMKELAEALNTILRKIEIKQIQKERSESYSEDELNEEDFDEDILDDDESEYDDYIIDLLFDVFELVQGNVPACYTGADVTTGMLGLIALYNKSAVSVITSLLMQVQMLQSQLLENDKEKIEIMKKQNELLEKFLNK